MIVDAEDQPHGSVVTTEVCIVGGGPAAITMALELRGAGFRVLLLEAGGWTESRADQLMSRGESVGHSYFPLDMARIRAFGGSSNHWRSWSGLRARPLDELDFSARPEVGREGWPFERAVLDPYYRRAQTICTLGPYDYEPSTWASPDTPVLPVSEETAETVMFQTGPLGQFVARLPEVLTSGNVSLMLHANVLQILTDDLGTRATRVEVGARPGHRFGVEATVFVLAAGGLENPRLLLASRQNHTTGLGNAHDVVGRHFMEHPAVKHNGVLVTERETEHLGLYGRRTTRGTSHIAMLKLTDAVLRREGLLPSVWSFTATSPDVVSAPGRAAIGLAALTDLRDVRDYRGRLVGTGARIKTLARHPATTVDLAAKKAGVKQRRRKSLLRLTSMSEQLPNPDSRITLSTRRDPFGSPQAKLDWRLTDLDLHSIRRTQELLGDAFADAGVGKLEQRFEGDRPPWTVAGGYHPMGTTRMHASPNRGVVDADGKVHGVSNLYIAGMSVFPTSGYANPTLTVVALAARLAAHVRKDLAAPLIGHRPSDPLRVSNDSAGLTPASVGD